MQLGPEVFVKVKAYSSFAAAISSGATSSIWFLNQTADRFAKLGARLHAPPPGLLRTWAATRQLQRMLLLWVGHITAALSSVFPRDVEHRDLAMLNVPAPRPLFRDTGHAAYAISDGVFVCAFCKARRGNFLAFQAFRCPGGLGRGSAHLLAALVQQFAESETHQRVIVGHAELAACAIAAGYLPHTGHQLTHFDGVFYCSRCGAYGTKHLKRLLALRCMPPTARGHANKRALSRGLHPDGVTRLEGVPVTLFRVVLPPLREDGSDTDSAA